jgi:hypothetical protein
MTYKEISQMIAGFGLPFAYYQFPDGTEQAPPFICFFYEYDDIHADNINYVGRVVLHIELYTDNKDFGLESNIETTLKQGGFSFSKEATYIDSERMWQTTYTMEVLIHEQG